jgi:hypothetical protein
MKKIKFIIAAVAMLSLVSSSAVYADGFAPGEGLYVGAFVGHSGGHVQAKVVANQGQTTGNDSNTGDTTINIADGGVGLSGIEGGGYLGYGYKMGSFYAGFEWDMAAGGAKFEITSDKALMVQSGADATPITDEILSKVSAETQFTTGGGGRIGYYVNPDTLITVKGGIAASKIDVTFAASSDSYYAGGPRIGASVESRMVDIDPNLSVRLSWDYTDYLTSPVSGIGTEVSQSNGDKLDSEVTGAMYQARIGLQYSFFDVNSLF